MRFGKNFGRFSKTALYVLVEPSDEKHLFGKKYFQNVFRAVSRSLNSLLPFQMKLFQKKTFFFKKKKIESFLDLRINFFKFLTNTLWQSGQNWILGVQRNIFHDKQCFWRKLKQIGHSAKVSEFCRNFQAEFLKLHSTCQRNILRKNFFAESFFPLKILGLWAEDFCNFGKKFSTGFFETSF